MKLNTTLALLTKEGDSSSVPSTTAAFCKNWFHVMFESDLSGQSDPKAPKLLAEASCLSEYKVNTGRPEAKNGRHYRLVILAGWKLTLAAKIPNNIPKAK